MTKTISVGSQVKIAFAGWVTVTAILDAQRIAGIDKQGRSRIFRAMPHDVQGIR